MLDNVYGHVDPSGEDYRQLLNLQWHTRHRRFQTKNRKVKPLIRRLQPFDFDIDTRIVGLVVVEPDYRVRTLKEQISVARWRLLLITAVDDMVVRDDESTRNQPTCSEPAARLVVF